MTRITLLLVVLLAGCVALLWPRAGEATSVASAALDVELLTDFTDAASNERWYPRNDDIMGGKSPGELAIDAEADAGDGRRGVLTMFGRIDLDGGGFTSVIMDVADGDDGVGLPSFEGVRGIRFRVRADADPHRPWRFRVTDGVRRSRSINFRGTMTFNIARPTDQWQTVTVWLQHLRPTLSGRELDPADWQPLDVASIRTLGVVLNDTGAGPYQLQIERIELVR
ncbi:MAG: CIA30 family protein [Planctomycetota bacterium]